MAVRQLDGRAADGYRRVEADAGIPGGFEPFQPGVLRAEVQLADAFAVVTLAHAVVEIGVDVAVELQVIIHTPAKLERDAQIAFADEIANMGLKAELDLPGLLGFRQVEIEQVLEAGDRVLLPAAGRWTGRLGTDRRGTGGGGTGRRWTGGRGTSRRGTSRRRLVLSLGLGGGGPQAEQGNRREDPPGRGDHRQAVGEEVGTRQETPVQALGCDKFPRGESADAPAASARAILAAGRRRQ